MTAAGPTLDRSASTAVTTFAAVGAAGVCVVFAGLQVAEAAGAPPGEHVWGGGIARASGRQAPAASGS